MSDSTSILDLPSDPAGSTGTANVQMKSTESISPQQQQTANTTNLTLDQMTINQIVSGIQQASASGATQLPSRDIPMNPSAITNDAFIQPNFVPPTFQKDYIQEDESSHQILERYSKQKQHSNRLDDMYSDLQTPLLLAALYFLFQLPFFRKFLMNYFPVFFALDGNLNIKGFMFMSGLFGFTYYFFNHMNMYLGSSF